MTETDPFAQFCAMMESFTHDMFDKHLAVAVSGGGDSMALLDMARRWATSQGWRLSAVTVDHGLRDVTAEVALVADYCGRNGIEHDIQSWDGTRASGNLQDAARTARRDLIAGWADRKDIDAVLLGHTADDQAETVLMRLARGSGVDGLAGMPVSDDLIFRPLLGVTRAALRDYLTSQEVGWKDDPSNDDTRFDRIKARQMMDHLSTLGLTRDRLLQTADHMRRARDGLNALASERAKQMVACEGGDLILDAALLRSPFDEAATRIFAGAIRWFSGTAYKPRFDALTAAFSAARQGETRTLGGVILTPLGGGVRLSREFAAVQAPIRCFADASGMLWDHRWILSPSAPAEGKFSKPAAFTDTHEIRALGDDLPAVKGWRETGLPRDGLRASPSIWQGETLISAPVAGLMGGFTARLSPEFASSLTSH